LELEICALSTVRPHLTLRLFSHYGRRVERAIPQIAPIDPDDPRAQHCLREYVAELDRRFPTGFDVARSIPADASQLRPPAGLMLLASLDSEPIGCGALKFHGADPTEIKRMWVAESVRGRGVGRLLLAELEARAAESSSPIVRLETNGALSEAVAMYRKAGYREVAPFNDEPYADHWFEKSLLQDS
jgi:GNAT superfamily N-acetyltransferase